MSGASTPGWTQLKALRKGVQEPSHRSPVVQTGHSHSSPAPSLLHLPTSQAGFTAWADVSTDEGCRGSPPVPLCSVGTLKLHYRRNILFTVWSKSRHTGSHSTALALGHQGRLHSKGCTCFSAAPRFAQLVPQAGGCSGAEWLPWPGTPITDTHRPNSLAHAPLRLQETEGLIIISEVSFPYQQPPGGMSFF